MPPPIKTIRQIKALVRQNPGAAARRIVSTQKNALERQSALNGLMQSNRNLRNIKRDIADTYTVYGEEPPFNPFTAFDYNQALLSRDIRFGNWKKQFAPIPDTRIYIPFGEYGGGHFIGRPFKINRTMDTYWPKVLSNGKIDDGIRIDARNSRSRPFWSIPSSQLQFIQPQGGYFSSPTPKLPSAIAPIPTFETNLSPDSYNAQKSFTQPYNSPFTDEIDVLPFKKGGKIHIKKANRGKFTDYCGGKVTSECIAKGKRSSNPAVRKRATFAANARKWKHENGGTIEKYQLGKLFKPIVKRVGDYRTLGKSLKLQKAADALNSSAARSTFWWGREYKPGDIFSASYFTHPEKVWRVGKTLKVGDGPGIDNFLRARTYDTYGTKADAIENMSLVNDDFIRSSGSLKGTPAVMRKLATDAQKMHSGNIAALVKPDDLSIDSYPLYVKYLQRGAINGKGIFEPILDDGVPRMIQLNTYGEGGRKSLQRIDRIIKELQKDYPDLPGRITLPGSFMGDGFRLQNHFVPAFKFTQFKKGGNI